MAGKERGRPRIWTEEKIEAELRAVIKQIGEWPSRRTLQEMGRADLIGGINSQGGLRYWADRLGYAPGPSRGHPHWTDRRIREALRPLLKDRTTFPVRREFEQAGLGGLWHALQKQRALQRWAREFDLPEPKRGRPLKDD